MAPIRSPPSLQNVCLEQISHNILKHASICQYYNMSIMSKEFQTLGWYIREWIPTLLRSNLFHIILKKMSSSKGENIHAEIIIFLMQFFISDEIRSLNFSDLIHAGSVGYDVLDTFENGMGDVFPYLPKLTHLDLSTHKNEVSLPSCSYNIMESIGWNCPNLRILNLNNNNRVTNDCIKCLEPMNFRLGCPRLEEIYLQECSITNSIITWLLETFENIKKIGYSEMGSILCNYFYTIRSLRHKPKLKLRYIDNSESTCSRPDGSLVRIISRLCPDIDNIRIRVSDTDCDELYRLRSLTKLELKFYTGFHHPIGNTTLNYLCDKGHHLSSLTLFSHELLATHVMVISKYCFRLTKLFLHCNEFIKNEEFSQSKNRLEKLKMLSLRIGQHEMDEARYVMPLVQFILEDCHHIEEVYFLFVCRGVNDNFFTQMLHHNSLEKLKMFIYDAPRRNRDLPVIPMSTDIALHLIEECPNLATIGNLISWQVGDSEVSELKERVRRRNFDVNIICSTINKVNPKYF